MPLLFIRGVTWDLHWDEVLPYVSMGYRMSKRKSVGYSPYILLYGREPMFPSHLQHLEDDVIDPQHGTPAQLTLHLV